MVPHKYLKSIWILQYFQLSGEFDQVLMILYMYHLYFRKIFEGFFCLQLQTEGCVQQ